MSQAEDLQTRFRVKPERADLLTKLPDDVRQKILECLPLKEAVRTSILSTHWKYEWAKLQQIKFDVCLLSTSSVPKFINIVNNVLLCHVGNLRKFALHIPSEFINDPNLYQWLTFLSRKSVRKLSLICRTVNMNKLPSVVFSYTELTHLTLHGFKLSTLPSSFSGFPCLVSLKLLQYDLESRNSIERFIKSCPQLLFLHLYYTPLDLVNLTIHAPKLEHLVVETTQIRRAQLDVSTVDRFNLVSSYLPRLQSQCCFVFSSSFCCFLNVLCLKLLKFLYNKLNQKNYNRFRLNDHITRRLKFPTLELHDVAVHCPGIIYFAVKLLNSSPLLRRLYFKVSDQEDGWHIDMNPPLSNPPNIELGNLPSLKYVEIVCAACSSVELQFLKGILKCAPVLEVLTIKFSDKVEENKEIAMNLMQHPRASTNAQIIFKA